VTAKARKRIEALEEFANARIAQEEERTRRAEVFRRKLEKMTLEERAEIDSIRAYWEELAGRLGLRGPMGRGAQLTLFRNTPLEILQRYLAIVRSYPDD
jgi:hypothetical protein